MADFADAVRLVCEEAAELLGVADNTVVQAAQSVVAASSASRRRNDVLSPAFAGFQSVNLDKVRSENSETDQRPRKKTSRRTASLPRRLVDEPDKTESKRCTSCSDKCGGSLAQKSNLGEHSQLTNADKAATAAAVAPYACQQCRRRFKRKETLQRHIATHDEKAFLCDECNQTFSSALSLREHRAIHDGELPYECSYCLRKFRQNSCFHRHLLTHSAASPPHQCTTCGRRFTQKIYLRSHIRSHTGERPFRCLTCGKSFGHRSTLKRHQVTHTGDRPYSCQVCASTFADLSSLRRHLAKNTHPKQQTGEPAGEQASSDVATAAVTTTTNGSVTSRCSGPRVNAATTTSVADYARNPDFGSRDYFDWLSEFIGVVTSSRLPMDNGLFARVSRVHGDISEVLATPFGPLSHDKDAFLCLVNMSQRLHAIIQNHHRSFCSSSSTADIQPTRP